MRDIKVHKRFVIEDNVDILYSNKELKRIVKRKFKDNNISIYYFCKQLGLNYKNVITWLTSMKSEYKFLSHRELMKIAANLGIMIKIQLVVHDDKIDDLFLRTSYRKRDYTIEDESLEDTDNE